MVRGGDPFKMHSKIFVGNLPHQGPSEANWAIFRESEVDTVHDHRCTIDLLPRSQPQSFSDNAKS
jgi:hypothetical protein